MLVTTWEDGGRGVQNSSSRNSVSKTGSPSATIVSNVVRSNTSAGPLAIVSISSINCGHSVMPVPMTTTRAPVFFKFTADAFMVAKLSCDCEPNITTTIGSALIRWPSNGVSMV